MKKKKKISRKQLLKEPDEFLALSTRLFNYTMENINYVLISIGSLLALTLFVVLINYFFASSERKASFAFQQALAKYVKFQNEDSSIKMEDILKDLDKIKNKHSGASSGKIALLLYANACYDAGRFDKAIELYKKAAKKIDKNSSLYPFTQQGLAYSFAEIEDYETSISYFEKVISSSTPMLKESALFQLGIFYDKIGNTQKSKENFEKLSLEFKDTKYSKIALDQISQLDNS